MKSVKGIFYAVIAYSSWGILPLYWKFLENVPALDILAHRILWSSVFTMAFCLFFKRNYLQKYFTNPKSLATLMVSGILVSTNWGIFVYSVVSEQIIQASLGYFMSPLVSIVLGMFFLGEKLNKIQFLAFLLAIAGVAYLTINYGNFPWIAIILALTFGVYGLMKKKMNYDSMSALAVETTLIVPIALLYIFFANSIKETQFVIQYFSETVLLVLAGVVTAVPLYWFGMATVRINLYAIGFFQYIAPTMKLFIGIFLFHETFSSTHAISFSLIWAGLALYMLSLIIELRKEQIRQRNSCNNSRKV